MFSKSDTLPLDPFILGNQRKRVRFKPGMSLILFVYCYFKVVKLRNILRILLEITPV